MAEHIIGGPLVAGLQRQLRAAREERDEVNETLIIIRGRELEAISRWRGEDVQRYLMQPDYGELLDWLNVERIQAIEQNKRIMAWVCQFIEKRGTVVFTGLSVPKRRLDEAIAEHAQATTELWERIRSAERDAKGQRALVSRLFDYVMVQEGGFKDVSLANEVADYLGPAEALSGQEEVSR